MDAATELQRSNKNTQKKESYYNKTGTLEINMIDFKGISPRSYVSYVV